MSRPGKMNGVAAAASQASQEAGLASGVAAMEQQLHASRNQTLLDLFASRAPETIPGWMRFEGLPEVKMPLSRYQACLQQPLWGGMSANDKDAINAWFNVEFDEGLLPEPLLSLAQRIKSDIAESRRLHEADICEIEARKYFAWRWFYAQKMVASRPE